MFPRPAALILLCLLAFPAKANSEVDTYLDAMASATTEQAFSAAAQDLLALGPEAVPALTARLIAADADTARIELTFLLGLILGQAQIQGETIDLPPELADEVAALLLQPADIALEANLANLAARFEPQPAAVTEGLLALLARADDEGLRATTSAVIAMNAGPSALPLIHDALRQSPSDSFAGDIALILRGSELPEDIAAIFVALLNSENSEARQAASRLLDDADITDPAQLDAALRDLESAQTDMQLLNAAMAVRNHTDGSERVAGALGRAVDRAKRVEERVELIRALGATGQPGHARFAEIVTSSADAEVVPHLLLGALASPELSESEAVADAFVSLLLTAEDPAIAEEAAFAVTRYRQLARPKIEKLLADDELSPQIRDQLNRILTMP